MHIDGKHRLIVIFYSSFSLDSAPLMEIYVKVSYAISVLKS